MSLALPANGIPRSHFLLGMKFHTGFSHVFIDSRVAKVMIVIHKKMRRSNPEIKNATWCYVSLGQCPPFFCSEGICWTLTDSATLRGPTRLNRITVVLPLQARMLHSRDKHGNPVQRVQHVIRSVKQRVIISHQILSKTWSYYPDCNIQKI